MSNIKLERIHWHLRPLSKDAADRFRPVVAIVNIEGAGTFEAPVQLPDHLAGQIEAFCTNAALAKFGLQPVNPPAGLEDQDGFGNDFQARVWPWLLQCFGAVISADRIERNQRFLEEALELVQANGASRAEAHALVDYVFGREIGELKQEAGGVMVTLAALCLASGVNMHAAGEEELTRIWGKIGPIRDKQAAKTRFPSNSLTGLAEVPPSEA